MKIYPLLRSTVDVKSLGQYLSDTVGTDLYEHFPKYNSGSLQEIDAIGRLFDSEESLDNLNLLAGCFIFGFLVVDDPYVYANFNGSFIRPIPWRRNTILLNANLLEWRDGVVYHLRQGHHQPAVQHKAYIKIFEMFETYGFNRLWARHSITYQNQVPFVSS